MSDTRIAAIRARLEAATEGPWEIYEEPVGRRSTPTITVAQPRGNVVCRVGPKGIKGVAPDANLIAHAPADIAFLLEQIAAWQATAAQALAEVERLKLEIEKRKAEW
jgi:hypothetical protein